MNLRQMLSTYGYVIKGDNPYVVFDEGEIIGSFKEGDIAGEKLIEIVEKIRKHTKAKHNGYNQQI